MSYNLQNWLTHLLNGNQLYKNNPLFTDFLNGPADVAILFSNIEVIVSVNVLLLEKVLGLHRSGCGHP